MRLFLKILLMCFALAVAGTGDGCAALKSNELGEFVVWGRRTLNDIGVQKTTFDSAMLKENIALSIADVLGYNSSLFVKSYGRATLSTVSFRGTSPSHTRVTWNGMQISNPMLGMTDFSTIPSYFVDAANLLHGASSVNETGGGLGGLVQLGSVPDITPGLKLQYVQGLGSFKTFDEFLKVGYSKRKWSLSTRAFFSSSPNDYTYINHDKKLNIYDENRNIVGQYYPKERNRSGAFRDLHVLQEIYFNTGNGDHLGFNAWYINSRRELPLLTVDYATDDADFENVQYENTFRSVFSWDHVRDDWRVAIKGGYAHMASAYNYSRSTVAGGAMAVMSRSKSRVNTVFGRAKGEFNLHPTLKLVGDISMHQHFVKSLDRDVIAVDGDRSIVGYDKARLEISGAASVRWQAHERVGVSAVLREELAGDRWSDIVPALFVDGLLSRKGNLMARASVSSNHRFPTLNDLYFLPGGNPDLKDERGMTYDAGLSFDVGKPSAYSLGGSLTWFDSYISDWIMWLPTSKGFFSPRNVKKVHAYGLEMKANLAAEPAKGWFLDVNASLSWTPSINKGDKMSDADRSVGKQLPYVPEFSSSMTARLSWKSWSLLYKWCWYSERYTMSSNDNTLTGKLPDYFMNNISVERLLSFRPVDLSLKLTINNLFDEEYLSVLSHPMPGINFEFFIAITPKF